ncbi:MAG TPA: copper resistance protein CopC [Herpetosiphonaceae bacterium]
MIRATNLSGLILLALLAILAPASTSAHAHYVSSDPAEGSTVASAPASVTINFSQLVDASKSRITVTNASGATVSTGAATAVANDGKAMQVALAPNLGPGTYTVAWENVSAEDGEADSGDFTFTVGTSGTPQASAAPAQQLPNTGRDSTLPLLITLAGLLAVAGVTLRGWALQSARHEG